DVAIGIGETTPSSRHPDKCTAVYNSCNAGAWLDWSRCYCLVSRHRWRVFGPGVVHGRGGKVQVAVTLSKNGPPICFQIQLATSYRRYRGSADHRVGDRSGHGRFAGLAGVLCHAGRLADPGGYHVEAARENITERIAWGDGRPRSVCPDCTFSRRCGTDPLSHEGVLIEVRTPTHTTWPGTT